MITMNTIQWPKKWVPGETDNFVSNEVIVKGLDFNKVVQHLRDLGKIGQGSGAKLSINSLLAQMGVAYSEALLLAKHLGVDAELFLQIIGQSGMNSPLFQAKKGMWLQDSYPAAFSLKLMLKDIRLANNEAGEAIQLPFLFKAQELYSQAEKSGLGEMDMAAVYHYLKKGDH
ncbi:NAD-binding protein [Helicobacter pylori]